MGRSLDFRVGVSLGANMKKHLIICFVLGVVLTLLSVPASAFVAQHFFGFMSGQRPRHLLVEMPSGDYFGVTVYGGPGMRAWSWGFTRVGPGLAAMHRATGSSVLRPERDPSPWWARGFQLEDTRSAQTVVAGWPLPCAKQVATSYWMPSTPWMIREEPSVTLFGRHYILPKSPVWRGLAANIAIYSIALYTVLFLRSDIRRALRVRAGKCERCGYQLLAEQDACPECGSSRAATPPHAGRPRRGGGGRAQRCRRDPRP